MGGKSYYCDYCKCYMKNDVNVRKIHNSGLTHKIAKVSYMRIYEDPKVLLAEERSKVLCTRYLKGYCKFDLYCQYGHFSENQLQQLQKIVSSQENKARQSQSKRVISKTDWQQQLPWQRTEDTANKQRNRKTLFKQLPRSLKAIDFNKLRNQHLATEWG